MMVYILYFSFLVVGACLFKGKYVLGYLKFAISFLCIIIGCRNIKVGVDTSGYIEDFYQISAMNIDMLIKCISETKEPLYYLLSWFISLLSSSPTVFLLFWAMIPSVSLYYFLKEANLSTKGLLLSFLCFFSLGLFAFFVAGIRQTAAKSVVLIAYRCLIKNEIKWRLSFIRSKSFLSFLLWMLVAYYLHNSSILFLLVLPLLKIKVCRWYLPFALFLFFIGNFIKIGFLVELSTLFFNDRFATYGTVYESSQSINAFIMQLILFTICYIKRNELLKRDYRNRYIFNVLLVGLVFQSMSGMIYEMARVAFYFSIFFLILVPKAIEEYSIELKRILYVGITSLLLVYLFCLSSSNLPEYSFI